MRHRFASLLLLLLAACSDSASERAVEQAIFAADPVIARALHDPLMSDPDLASRNEANAAIGFIDSSALPVFPATLAEAQGARQAGRLELLAVGAIPALPLPEAEPRGTALGAQASAGELLAALGAPADCAGVLEEDFALSAALPSVAAIMPHGMVVQAGGADAPRCRIRIIRYQTQAAPEDVLQYHYTRAVRAGLEGVRHKEPEDILAASGPRDETLVVHARTLASGLTGVDLLYRAS
jgi:hypothetical protein